MESTSALVTPNGCRFWHPLFKILCEKFMSQTPHCKRKKIANVLNEGDKKDPLFAFYGYILMILR